nr:MAG TPA: hypothetical protein [Caudoviricetes sp.]
MLTLMIFLTSFIMMLISSMYFTICFILWIIRKVVEWIEEEVC